MSTPVELRPFELHHHDAVLALWRSAEGLVDNPEALAFWRRVGWTVRDDVAMMSRTVSGGEDV